MALALWSLAGVAASLASASSLAASLTITGAPPATAVVAAEYRFTPTSSGGEGSRRFFRVRGKPDWASFNWRTGALVGKPTSSQIGDYTNVRISVTDGRTTAALPAFSIKVVSTATASPSPTPSTTTPNRAPVLSGAPPTTAVVGAAYAFQPSASDPDGDALTFTVQGRPAWASFSPTTARLAGTPTSADVGTTAAITIMASDGKTISALPSFTIQVAAGTSTIANRAPTITGTPATTATVGQPYSFQPAGSDADGDTIAYGISNQPAWASFSTSTGRLSGTPTSANVGTYGNIVIAVSDAKANATLAPFSIVVNQVAMASVTLSWDPPTMNEDGTPLVDLAGYRIHYGTSATAPSQSIEVANPGLTSYVVPNLGAGTWYFSITSFNRSGVSSDRSSVASHSVP